MLVMKSSLMVMTLAVLMGLAFISFVRGKQPKGFNDERRILMKSVVSYPDRGRFGNNRYRGNCSGRLIEDIISQYHIQALSDYMAGGGTTEEVCRAHDVSGVFLDLNRGFDMMSMDIPERPQNIFWHPPYGQMITYSDEMYSAQSIIDQYGFDPRINDLSRAKDWDDFTRKMNYCCLKQFTALEKGGRMFVLMGDWKQKGKLYSMLCDIAKPGVLEQIVIKTQHNCVSDGRTYSNQNFVPIVHEYLMVVRKDEALLIPVALTKKTTMDMRDSRNATWRDVIAAILEDAKCPMSLDEIYAAVEGHKKCTENQHWRDKVRQTLQIYNCFQSIQRGIWQTVRAA